VDLTDQFCGTEEWETNELCPWFYDFCADGYPKMKDPFSEEFVRYSPDSFVPDRSLLSFAPKPKEGFESRDRMNGAAVENWTWKVHPVIFVDHKGNQGMALPTILEVGEEDTPDSEEKIALAGFETLGLDEKVGSEALPPGLASNIPPQDSLPHPPEKQEDFLGKLAHLTNTMHGWYGLIEGKNPCVTT
jgi:hypothetical protein